MPAEADRERIVELRRQALERAGFSPQAAQDLAGRLELDLRQARSLVERGFPPDVAYDMLLSGSRPVF